MLKKGSKLYSILTGTCPKCQNESMYVDKNLFNLSKIFEMHERCSHCGTKYKIEPSFFFGAMYVSYAFTVGIMLVGGFVIYNFFGDPEPLGYIIPIVLISLLFVPFNFRISRVLLLYLFSGISYKSQKKDA